MALDPAGLATAVGMKLVELAIGELPELGRTLERLLEGAPDDLPLVDELRQILPLEGAAARARRALERG